ncbi:glycoside hydrolase family 78 protein [Actinotalea sp. M2MS4P-6]|uniref:alpha-L-rhamnosidase n=1 Tax=Actinotalea sp. M2MS4P-6 TaxID=2983762 RepID=UPI0021E3D36D|nr:alpha-L-rhamnosidase [Actinotalea sp. M2MS4P-6]MCV2394403.1 glycoside hydrolase family 78 protein [Actinotalea sp. M2MS4P-6]
MTFDVPAPILRVEHHAPPSALGTGEARPRLSWQIARAPGSYRQAAYEVSWRTTAPDGTTTEESSSVTASADQVLVPWPGAPLAPRHRAEVRARTQDAATGLWGPWSEPVVVERGLGPDDWRAELVGPGYPEGPEDDRRAPLVRGRFTVPTGSVAAARLHVTAHGLVEVELNGTRVGQDELHPGWTPYAERLRVRTYDVTGQVRPGENAIGAWLADGWFRGRFGFEGGTTDIYGDHVGVLAQLEITLDDGSTVTIGSDATWRSAPGPLTRASLYDGERIDLRLLPAGWSEPGFDDSAWAPVAVLPLDRAVLAAPDAPPVRCTEVLEPVEVTAVDGGWLLDYGQNHSGRPRVRLPEAPAGTHVTIQHAEVLQDGRVYRRPLRQAAATDEIITDGRAVEWEPRFTVHGYRYAFVTGWPGTEPPAPGAVVSRVLHSDMARTGWFSSDRADLDRLHENVVWGLRSNFVDIPTDCPQRDERLGWTGDIQLFAPTAAFLYDVHGVLSDWLRSVSIEQQRYGGTVPVYVPWVPGGQWWRPDMDVAAWGDAATVVPEALFRAFDDRDLLVRQYESARTWVDKVAGLAGPSRLWDQQLQLGDWLDPAAPPDRPMQAMTDPHLVSTAYFARSADALAGIAAALGRDDDAAHYAGLAAEVRAAFVGRYVGTGDPMHDTVCAHAVAIAFDLLPDAERDRAGDRLDELVRARGCTVSTGFVGTPVVTDALTATGHLDTAYRLLLSHDDPSWLATVDRGATTIWERWDSMLADGTVNPGDMTSFNHYALGSVMDWVHRTVGGLAPAAPGYRELLVAPRPAEGITRARVRHLTPYGEAAVAWELRDGELVVSFTVPVGTTAVVDLPGQEPFRVGHGDHEATVPA